MIIKTPAQLYSLFYKNIIGTEKYSSSAKQLDDQIKNSGYLYPKFYHLYQLPNSRARLAIRSALLLLFSNPKEGINHLEQYLKQNIEISDDLYSKLDVLQKKAESEILRLTRYIKIYNKELRNIDTSKSQMRIHFIRGAIYGYPPENIDFWMKNYPDNEKFNEGRDYTTTLIDKFGIRPEAMRLTLAQKKSLVESLESQRINMFEKVDTFGRKDTSGFLCFQEAKGYYEY